MPLTCVKQREPAPVLQPGNCRKSLLRGAGAGIEQDGVTERPLGIPQLPGLEQHPSERRMREGRGWVERHSALGPCHGHLGLAVLRQQERQQPGWRWVGGSLGGLPIKPPGRLGVASPVRGDGLRKDRLPWMPAGHLPTERLQLTAATRSGGACR